MKFDEQKTFPYPVLRPHNDDYLDSDIQTTAEFLIDHDGRKVNFEASIAISSEDILELIEQKKAHVSVNISCRSTFFRKSLKTFGDSVEGSFDYGDFKDEVEVSTYVVANERVSNFFPEDLNPEFGETPFKLEKGDVLAMDEPQISYFDRDSFKPLSSIFSLVKNPNKSDSEWVVELSESDIVIVVSPSTKEVIDVARNNKTHLAVLMNSLYFSALTHAISALKVDEGEYTDRKWAKVLTKKIHNTDNLDLAKHESYVIAQELLKNPLQLLKSYVFKE
jgi:hypothetical protein